MRTLAAIGRRDGYLFKSCTEDKALEILQDRSVLQYLSVYPVGLKDVEKYLIDDRALLIVMPKEEEVEVHIAAKYRDRAFLKDSLKMGIEWLKYRGFSRITTTAPDNRIGLINLLTSLGFQREGKWWVVWA